MGLMWPVSLQPTIQVNRYILCIYHIYTYVNNLKVIFILLHIIQINRLVLGLDLGFDLGSFHFIMYSLTLSSTLTINLNQELNVY
jgi:hypothetical protein